MHRIFRARSSQAVIDVRVTLFCTEILDVDVQLPKDRRARGERRVVNQCANYL